jgi:signal transduction histidine kinase
MTVIFAAAVVVILILYAAMLAFTLGRLRLRRAALPALLMLLLGAISAAALLVPSDARAFGRFGTGLIHLAAFGGALTAIGFVTFADLRRPLLRQRWGIAAAVWAVMLAAVALVSPQVSIGNAGWLRGGLGLTEIIAVACLIAVMLAAAAILLRGAYASELPEVANRNFYWLVQIALIVTGAGLALSGEPLLALGGHVPLLAAIAGVLYVSERHRAFDVRGGIKTALVAVAVTLIGAAVLLTVLYVMRSFPLPDAPEQQSLALAVVAVVAAAAFIPIWQLAHWFAALFFRVRVLEPSTITHEFSQQVARAVDLKEIVTAATDTLNTTMKIQRSGLMLVNNTVSLDGFVELLAMQGGSFGRDMKGVTLNIPLTSALYQRFAVEQQPLSQFDVEYNPRYADISAAERAFLAKQKMHAYAPIIMDSVMIGLLMVGAKIDDTVYNKPDLDMLSTLAQQVGFALRNARLVADLRHLNETMHSLNSGLEEANQELERLDSVKTDFVTIASHELRTPLAQIRGYTDMIDAINEAGMLEQTQVTSMVGNLRKATERMEELIAAMLDVSQIDVNAMDLRFTETTPETILRMAIEPLTNEIRQRKLNLTARWKGLPPVQADLQRMVQAFRNIVVNAIKFTPDGGQIEIVATLQPSQNAKDIDHVLVSISDTGVGIDKGNLELIFKKFYRTFDPQLHSTGAYKFLGAGPGLGLTIAKGVIEAHGGKIWAESEYHSIDECPG